MGPYLDKQPRVRSICLVLLCSSGVVMSVLNFQATSNGSSDPLRQVTLSIFGFV